jgi:hypothetical protein
MYRSVQAVNTAIDGIRLGCIHNAIGEAGYVKPLSSRESTRPALVDLRSG